MILICGILADRMIELLCARAQAEGVPYLFFDMLEFPGRCNLTWEMEADGVTGTVAVGDRKCELRSLSGIYARYVDYREPGQSRERDRVSEMKLAEWQSAIMELLDVTHLRVINRPKASTSNDSKVFQAKVIRDCGLRTPRTLVTTDPDSVRSFYDCCGGRVIYKSVSGVRSIVRRLDKADFDRLDTVRRCPTQFQEFVPGTDLRVHTVGEEVFVTEVRSAASDYRYASAMGEEAELCEAELPAGIADACLRLARKMGLEVAGIDLRRTPEGEFFCFEVNPSPGFIYYEASTGQPISRSVVRLLARDQN